MPAEHDCGERSSVAQSLSMYSGDPCSAHKSSQCIVCIGRYADVVWRITKFVELDLACVVLALTAECSFVCQVNGAQNTICPVSNTFERR